MTAYNKINWKDHIVDPITHEVIQEGTPLNQDNLNHMDKEIERLGQQLEQKANSESPQFTGIATLNGNEIATVNNIPAGLSLGETSSTAYRGDRGKTAYDHSQTTHAPSNAQKNSDITKAEIEAKLTGQISTHSHASDSTKAPNNHASTGTTHGVGNSNNYGHVKLSDSVDNSSGATSGIAATPLAVKSLNDKINNLSRTSIIKGAITKPNDNIASFNIDIPITSANTIKLDLSTNMTVQNATVHTNGMISIKIHRPSGKIKGFFGYYPTYAYCIAVSIGDSVNLNIADAYANNTINLRIKQISIVGSILRIYVELTTVINWNCTFDYIVEEIA